jgi:hypothetical protein
VLHQVLDYPRPFAGVVALVPTVLSSEVRVPLQEALRLGGFTFHGFALEAALLCKVRDEAEPIAGGDASWAQALKELGVAIRVALGVVVPARNPPPLLHGMELFVL